MAVATISKYTTTLIVHPGQPSRTLSFACQQHYYDSLFYVLGSYTTQQPKFTASMCCALCMLLLLAVQIAQAIQLSDDTSGMSIGTRLRNSQLMKEMSN